MGRTQLKILGGASCIAFLAFLLWVFAVVRPQEGASVEPKTSDEPSAALSSPINQKSEAPSEIQNTGGSVLPSPENAWLAKSLSLSPADLGSQIEDLDEQELSKLIAFALLHPDAPGARVLLSAIIKNASADYVGLPATTTQLLLTLNNRQFQREFLPSALQWWADVDGVVALDWWKAHESALSRLDVKLDTSFFKAAYVPFAESDLLGAIRSIPSLNDTAQKEGAAAGVATFSENEHALKKVESVLGTLNNTETSVLVYSQLGATEVATDLLKSVTDPAKRAYLTEVIARKDAEIDPDSAAKWYFSQLGKNLSFVPKIVVVTGGDHPEMLLPWLTGLAQTTEIETLIKTIEQSQ